MWVRHRADQTLQMQITNNKRNTHETDSGRHGNGPSTKLDYQLINGVRIREMIKSALVTCFFSFLSFFFEKGFFCFVFVLLY